jgi:hypothetical protein
VLLAPPPEAVSGSFSIYGGLMCSVVLALVVCVSLARSRHYESAAEAPARADGSWLESLSTRLPFDRRREAFEVGPTTSRR